jgi:hypothetical protein
MKYQAVYMCTLEINYRLTMFQKKGIIQVHVITFQSERNTMCEIKKKKGDEYFSLVKNTNTTIR